VTRDHGPVTADLRTGDVPPIRRPRESASIRFSVKTCNMEDRPVTSYVTAPDGVSLAYQVIGGGSLDLVFFAGLALPIDLLWEDPGFAHFARRLSRFSRTVCLEGRGIGASGGDFAASAVDENDYGQNVYGLTSVLDALGCGRVALVAHGSAGPVAIRYVAAHPERVATLVLVDSHAYYMREDDYPWGMPRSAIDRHVAAVREAWGSGAALDSLAPPCPHTPSDPRTRSVLRTRSGRSVPVSLFGGTWQSSARTTTSFGICSRLRPVFSPKRALAIPCGAFGSRSGTARKSAARVERAKPPRLRLDGGSTRALLIHLRCPLQEGSVSPLASPGCGAANRRFGLAVWTPTASTPGT